MSESWTLAYAALAARAINARSAARPSTLAAGAGGGSGGMRGSRSARAATASAAARAMAAAGMATGGLRYQSLRAKAHCQGMKFSDQRVIARLASSPGGTGLRATAAEAAGRRDPPPRQQQRHRSGARPDARLPGHEERQEDQCRDGDVDRPQAGGPSPRRGPQTTRAAPLRQ